MPAAPYAPGTARGRGADRAGGNQVRGNRIGPDAFGTSEVPNLTESVTASHLCLPVAGLNSRASVTSPEQAIHRSR